MSSPGFTAREAATVAGITYRQLDYWTRTDLIRPSLASGRGSGARRLYSHSDLVELTVVGALLHAGVRLERARLGFEALRVHGDDLASIDFLVIDREAVRVVRAGQSLVDVVLACHQITTVLALADVKDTVDAAVAALMPPAG